MYGEKIDSNYTRMLRAILNKSWRQHPTKWQLYGQLPPITKTIKIRSPSHAGHCWRSRDELISDVLLWTPSHGRAKEAGRPARTYIQQLCADMGCSPEELLEAMDDMEGWRESTTWWWSLSYFKRLLLFTLSKNERISQLRCSTYFLFYFPANKAISALTKNILITEHFNVINYFLNKRD